MANNKRLAPDRNSVKNVGPWTRLKSDLAYENPWISVHHEKVLTPAGTEGIYGLVHFKGTAVGVIPVDEDGNTWLVKQTRYTLEQESFEIPEGGAAPGEALEDCARRELLEEVGLHAATIKPLMKLHLSNSITDECAHVFIATDLSSGEINHEDSEDISIHKMPLKTAIKMVMAGEITDAISVAGLQHMAITQPEILRSDEVNVL